MSVSEVGRVRVGLLSVRLMADCMSAAFSAIMSHDQCSIVRPTAIIVEKPRNTAHNSWQCVVWEQSLRGHVDKYCSGGYLHVLVSGTQLNQQLIAMVFCNGQLLLIQLSWVPHNNRYLLRPPEQYVYLQSSFPWQYSTETVHEVCFTSTRL